jgi:hypothetical protein
MLALRAEPEAVKLTPEETAGYVAAKADERVTALRVGVDVVVAETVVAPEE